MVGRRARAASRNSFCRAFVRRLALTLINVHRAEREREVGLARQGGADQRPPVCFAHRAAERRHLDLQAQRVARPYLLTESAVLNARKEGQLASIGGTLPHHY